MQRSACNVQRAAGNVQVRGATWCGVQGAAHWPCRPNRPHTHTMNAERCTLHVSGSPFPAPRYQSLKLLVKRHRITYKYSTYVFTEMIIAMTSVFNELREPVEHLPLSPQDFQVLMVVFDQPLHGYGIVKSSADQSGKAVLDLGSLYRIISRLPYLLNLFWLLR